MNFDFYIIQSGQAVPENPYAEQEFTYDKYGKVDGGYINPGWIDFENWKQSHTLPFIGSLPDGSGVKREETEEVW